MTFLEGDLMPPCLDQKTAKTESDLDTPISPPSCLALTFENANMKGVGENNSTLTKCFLTVAESRLPWPLPPNP